MPLIVAYFAFREALDAKTELELLQVEKQTFDRRQSVIDLGSQILQKEDELSRRQSGLQDYEREVSASRTRKCH